MLKSNFEERMRRGEYFHALRVPEGVWTILRLDGRGFSKLTEALFEKPFDARFHKLMADTTLHVVEKLHGLYGFTESDEISVLLPYGWDLFDRELEKIVSLSASIASAHFSLGLGQPAHFDSRVWFGARRQDVVDYFRWRQGDAARCALNGWAYWTLRRSGQSRQKATQALHKATRAEKHELLYSHDINFNDLPTWQRRGVGVRWTSYQKEGHNPVTGESVIATRRRLEVDVELPMKDGYSDYIRAFLANPEGT